VVGSTAAVEAVMDAKGVNTELIESGAQIVPRFLFESGPIKLSRWTFLIAFFASAIMLRNIADLTTSKNSGIVTQHPIPSIAFC
jgi:hypothetical protein